MKKSFISFAILCLFSITLTSCDLIISPYDSNEYMLVNKIRTLSGLKICTPDVMLQLYLLSLELKNFSEYLPDNTQTATMTQDLYKMISDFVNGNMPSAAYCTDKLNIINMSATRIQKTIGDRPR
jgi:hypothetical protein